MTNVIHLRKKRPPLDVRPIACVLERMHPDLWATTLPAETVEEALARMEARADILDDLLAEAAAEVEALGVAA